MYETVLLPVPREELSTDFSLGLLYAGFGGSVPDGVTAKRAERALAETESLIEPKVCYVFSDVSVNGDTVSAAGASFRSRALSEHLAGCGRAVIFAATAGAALDRAIARRSVSSALDGALLDAFGSAAVEALCDYACASFAEFSGYDLTPRFSPGYGDLPLDAQADITELLSAQKNIGVSLTGGMMMVPAKSVTAIAGLLTKKTV